MKIVSWNCEGGFYENRKYKKIQKLDADIYVIQEVNKPKCADDEYEEFMKNSELLLYDDNDESGNNKGIAIIAKEGIKLDNNNWEFEYNDFLSLRVKDSFNLVGVWTHKKKGNSSKEYVNRMEKYLEDHDKEFINSDNLIICGDFNIDISLKEQEGQNRYIELLNKYGYESIYHKLNDEKFGEESVKTYYFKYDGKEYGNHLDQLFTKPEIISSFEVGRKEDFVDCEGPHSDHVPLIFEVDL